MLIPLLKLFECVLMYKKHLQSVYQDTVRLFRLVSVRIPSLFYLLTVGVEVVFICT
jgi:hypothetical protein